MDTRLEATAPAAAHHPWGAMKPGDLLTVAEVDYLYGLGVLRLRVTEIGEVHRLPDGGRWLQVAGMQLSSTGQDVKFRPYVLIRLKHR